MSTKFTPWHVDSKFLKERGCHEVLDSRNATIADVFGIDNARLFVAAPDLLSACRAAEDLLTHYGEDKDIVKQLRAAIDAAEGRGK